ncbi:C40 family peptidase (plasmid) [Brachybacterium halotolerans subsp. kimchii]|uniref:C40 family peptidase n=1 Tax=Brachybacterium halotolerans TaxID=2795215 RepID=UPI001E494419|nr:C40 family peptidase [Brachybacterium halotolerans]UEJ84614.1 C40 family peptidase [Brachybacterium halotolerans subsp. kimchii]
MSDSNAGKGVAWAIGLVLAVPFAIVPAGVLLLGDDDSTSGAACSASGSSSMALSVVGDVPALDGYTEDELKIAAVIMKAADNAGVGERGQIIGIMASLQETHLTNLPGGDRDSVGTFQQRPSVGWGTADQLHTPSYAAKAFYEGVDAKNGSHIPGLKDIDGWESMAPTQAAQAVQGSDYPDAYAKHQKEAEKILAALSGTEVESTGATIGGCATSGIQATGKWKDALERGRSLIGTKYDFGGGDENGPTAQGIDCSGFVLYVLKGMGTADLPRSSQGQFDALASTPVDEDSIRPGDLIFYAKGRTGTVGSPNAISHVAIYAGDGKMLESTRYSTNSNEPGVQEVDAKLSGSKGFVGIRRVPGTEQGAKIK